VPTEPRSAKALLQSSAALRQLGRRLAEQRLLLDEVRLQLPADLAERCRAAVLGPAGLTLYTDSPAWASRLRYLTPKLAERLPQGRRDVRVRVLAIPAQKARETRPRKVRRLSEEDRRTLLEVADACSEPRLSAALRRLAQVKT